MAGETSFRRPAPRALYVCYFGIDEPLVQTQVLPYLGELTAGGVHVALLTFEPDLARRWPASAVAERRRTLAAVGISWSLLPYHRRPSLAATAWDVFRGSRVARDIVARHGINIVHGRSHVGTAIAMLVKRRAAVRVIFDVRGLLAEEYVEKGRWRAGGLLFRTVKRAERALIRSADGFVVLTDAIRPMLLPADVLHRRPVAVVPCCVDPVRFGRAGDREAVRAALGVSGRRVFVHAGTVGGAYLTDELAAFLAVARDRDRSTFALVLTRDDAAPLVSALETKGLSAQDYRIVRADPAEVPKYLRAADVGVLMLRPAPARIGASPTKFAEYLAAGLPIVATGGTGDLDRQLDEHRVGVRLTGFDTQAYGSALDALTRLDRDSDRARRARDLVASSYDVRTVGGVRYRRLYDDVLRSCPSGVPDPPAARPAPAGQPPLRLLALTLKPEGVSPGQRFRLEQWAPRVARDGVHIDFLPFESPRLTELLYEDGHVPEKVVRVLSDFFRRAAVLGRARAYDAVVIYREAALVGPAILERLFARTGVPLFFDMDDAVWLAGKTPGLSGAFSKLHFWGKTATTCRLAAAVIAGNEYLADYARGLNPRVFVVPTSIELDRYPIQPELPEGSRFVIVWSGSRSTLAHLEHARGAIERFARDRSVTLRVICNQPPARPFAGVENEFIPWTEAGEAEAIGRAHAGIMPLPDDDYTRGKCGLKALQFMACGLPVVISPVGMNATLVSPGANGLLASAEDRWIEALGALASSRDLRRRLGQAGRLTIEREYSSEIAAARFARAVRDTLGERRTTGYRPRATGNRPGT